MAKTEFTNLDNSIRTVAENEPSLGCGYVFLDANQSTKGDFVAIQAVTNTASNLTLLVVDGSTGAWDVSGTPYTSAAFPANSVGKIIRRPFKDVANGVGGGAVILYWRCRG